MNKPRKRFTTLTCEELQGTIGQKVLHEGKIETIGAVYIYLNKNGICSIRIRFYGTRDFKYVNVENVYKKDDKIIYELKEQL